MANRNRHDRDPRQQGYSEDYRFQRQSEQFQPGGGHQYGESYEARDEYDDGARGGHRPENRRQPVRDGWRERGSRRTAEYDPLGDYDRASFEAGQRAAERNFTEHSTFRADDIGAAQPKSPYMPGPTGFMPGYGGYGFAPTFFSPGTTGYDERSPRDHDRGFFERAGDEIASWFGDEDAAHRREMDHRGRGPNNYKRSDERILEDACDRLTEDRGVDARNISVTAQDSEITLDGTVNTLWEKRRAEDCVQQVSGIAHVQNNLRLSQPEMRAGTTQPDEVR